ncbi:HD domain-containing protein [Desulfitobacterium sp. THU1]|uniref:HD domain-containing protein n=1 Tax=Desulfitobacterium sp. THU1 TaxID=3138072 RepID=UPI00311F9D45
MRSMPRVNLIIQHQSYEDYCRKNTQAEENRIYCRHGSDHGLTVSRIAYLYLLEKLLEVGVQDRQEQMPEIDKEIVYAAGLLHDIGRWVEYETQEDHALVSARISLPILRDCGFSSTEVEMIALGILEHRLSPDKTSSPLGQALALADDWARDCKNCPSQETCYKYSKSMEEIII